MKKSRLLLMLFFSLAAALTLSRCSDPNCVEGTDPNVIVCPVVDDDDIIDDVVDDIDQ